MEHYYVNDEAQTTGEHEVHKDNCTFLPSVSNRTYLGLFNFCSDAVAKAKEKHLNVDGCKFCCPACHTR
ncbi:hypothetical protein [Vibrio parahaemolyticus]|uniref:hypothetical protein n=1 Tax=Vibrio parahaemolyticus TaxID=670 RepID=UPI001E3BEE36|nr:hypothetical protein [Vibrio parahaemolyticus]